MLPYERYVRYLITCGRDLPEINIALSDLCLASLDKAHYTRIYKDLLDGRIPKDVKAYWRDPDKATMPKGHDKLMKDLNLSDAYAQTAAFKQMILFARNEPASMAVQAMLLKGMDHVELAALVGSRFNMRCDPAHTKLFEEYLFDVQSTDKESWRQYFGLAGSTLRAHLLDCFRLDIEALRAQHGLSSKMSYVSALQEMHFAAMTKFREYLRDRTPESDKNARNWAQLAMTAGSQFEKFRTKDLTDFSKEVSMEFEYVETKYPSIEELKEE